MKSYSSAADSTHALEAEVTELRQRLRALEGTQAENERIIRSVLETSETYRTLLDESSDPIFAFLRDGTYRYVNRAFADGVGKALSSIIGKKIWDVFSKDEADKRFAVVKWVFEHGESKVIEVRVPRPDGDRFYLTTVKPIFNLAAEVISVICISKEITERKRMEEELRRLSTFDILTGLYSRNFFETELARMNADPPYPVSVVVSDLDNLKIVNDRLGHAAGDELIRLAARVLQHSFRPTDMIARFGGDEFVVVLPETDQAALNGLLSGLMNNLQQQNDAHLRLSVGSATSQPGDSLLGLLRLADDRMYEHKKRNRRSAFQEPSS